MTTNLTDLALINRLKFADEDKGWYSCTERKLFLICEAYHQAKCAESEPVGYAPKAYLDNIDEELYVLSSKTQAGIYDTPLFLQSIEKIGE